jgi:hypothetical protein
LEQKERAAFDDNDLTTLGWKNEHGLEKLFLLSYVGFLSPTRSQQQQQLCFALLCFAWGESVRPMAVDAPTN